MLFKRRRRELFLSHRRRLTAYARAVSGEADVAAELVQDCAVRVLDAKNVPADEPAFRAWLFKIVRNLWLDRVRRSAVRGEVPLEEVDVEPQLPVPAETLLVNQLAVRLAFETLPAHHRDVLALVDVAGFSYDEAATLLDVPSGTVMSRVSRARSALAMLMRQDNIVELPVRRSGRTT